MNRVAIVKSLLLSASLITASACGAPEQEGAEAEPGERQQALTCAPSLSAAAITRQIVSASEPTQLTIELLTITPQPYQLQATGLSFPAGFVLRSLRTTECPASGSSYRCRHQAVIEATTACDGTGSYALSLRYVTVPGSGCPATAATERIPFSLATEYFCG